MGEVLPALDLKLLVNDEEFSQVNQKFLLNPKKLIDLRSLVSKHYRDNLSPEDLMDIQLMEESYTFLDELTQLARFRHLFTISKKLKIRRMYLQALTFIYQDI